jgi:hypothetical protein
MWDGILTGHRAFLEGEAIDSTSTVTPLTLQMLATPRIPGPVWFLALSERPATAKPRRRRGKPAIQGERR